MWITSLLFDLNYKLINGSFAFSPGLIYILVLVVLIKTSAYVVRPSVQTLRVGENRVSRKGCLRHVLCVSFFGTKLTSLEATNGVAWVKIWIEVSCVRLMTIFSESKFLKLCFLLGHAFGHTWGTTQYPPAHLEFHLQVN